MKYLLSLVLMYSLNVSAVSNGEQAPEFKLTGHDGRVYTTKELKGKHVVLEWFNEGCPFVKKHYQSNNMQNLQKKYGKDVVWLTINSSASGKQGHLKDVKAASSTYQRSQMKAVSLLLDSPGSVGRLYEAKTTPHMFVIGPKGDIVYQGAIDSIASADKADIKDSVNYVASALDQSLAGKKVKVAKTKAYGCGVKY